MGHNVEKKELEKIEKYQDLKSELEKSWNTNIEIVPIVIRALGAVSNNLEKYLKTIDLENVRIHTLQKTFLLKTDNIL